MAGKLKAGGLLALMFCLGVISGIALQIHLDRHGPPSWNHADHRIAHLKKELRLTPEQEVSVRGIFENAHQRAQGVHQTVQQNMAQIHKDSIDAIEKVLTPEQQAQFKKIHDRHHHMHPFASSETAETAPSDHTDVK